MYKPIRTLVITSLLMITVTATANAQDVAMSAPKFSVQPDDTTLDVGAELQFTARFKENGGAIVDTVAQWTMAGDSIGTISQDDLLRTTSPGVALITGRLDQWKATALITVADTTTDSSGTNVITFSRVLPDGRVLPAKTINEGESTVIGGLPNPVNILNGTRVFFPAGSLDEDITIHMQLPEFAKHENDSVDFGEKIVVGVTFHVFVNDSLVEPYFFNEPLNVAIPFKRGLIKDVDDLSLFFSEDGEILENTGISDVVVDSSANRIFGQIAHFSTLVVSEKRVAVSVDDSPGSLPGLFSLRQNYPNPFNPETTIEFQMLQASGVTLKIYNLLGQEIRTLIDSRLDAGSHRIVWNGNDRNGQRVASGLYLYQIYTGEASAVKRMTLLR